MAKKRTKGANLPASSPTESLVPANLLSDLRALIDSARAGLAQAVNSAPVMLYWQVGIRIRTDLPGSKRAGYGPTEARAGRRQAAR